MLAAVSTLPPHAVLTSDPVWRMSVQRYHEMIRDGNLTTEDPVELVEGVLVFKMPKDEPHNFATDTLDDLVKPMLDGTTHCYRSQASVTLEDGEPEPDGAVARGTRRFFVEQDRKPFGSELEWVAEVSDSTLRLDRGAKLRSYARAGIAVYWIVNLVDRTVEVHTHPDQTAATYGSVTVHTAGSRVPVVIAGLVRGNVAVSDLLA